MSRAFLQVIEVFLDNIKTMIIHHHTLGVGIFIDSDLNITVDAINYAYWSVDGFYVPCLEELGLDYRAVTYKFPGSATFQGELA